MADIAAAAADWEALAIDCHRFSYMSRAIELQRDAIVRLDAFETVFDEGRREAQAAEHGDEANMWLSLQSMLHALRSELRMFVALKEDRADAAWGDLVSAQNAAAAALMAHRGAEGFPTYSEKLFVHEENLFPPQLFMSPAMTVAHSECSICSSAYGECVHVAGRAYNGEFCARVITEVSEIEEISLVTHPKDKRRRVEAMTDEEGVKRNLLTWRPITENPPDEPSNEPE
jgi:hypothetical protein